MSDEDEEQLAGTSEDVGQPKKKRVNKTKTTKPGIIYLSSIPYFMTVRSIRDYFSKYGEIDRLFLQHEQRVAPNGRKIRKYTEGWVEFKDKDLAKRIAASLNNSMVGGKRRSKAFDCLWNIKYLHGFKWVHLSEQLTFEKAVHSQKLRAEISQAKREANYFAEQLDKGENLRKLEEKVMKKGGLWEKYQRQITQKKGFDEKTKKRTNDGGGVLGMIFTGQDGKEKSKKKRKMNTENQLD